jgi:hypothetical protein
MSLFQYNPFMLGEDLTPSALRKDKFTAWLRVLLRPMFYMADIFTDDFITGAEIYLDYDNATTYNYGDRVIYSDRGVYECMVASSVGVTPFGNALSDTNWNKILQDFISIDERIKTTSQIITLEYAINRYYRIYTAPFIYLTQMTPMTHGTVQINVPTSKTYLIGGNYNEISASLGGYLRNYVTGEAFVLNIY